MNIAPLFVEADAFLVDLFCFPGFFHIRGVYGGEVGQDLGLVLDKAVFAGGVEGLKIIIDCPGVIALVLEKIAIEAEGHGFCFRELVFEIDMIDIVRVIADGVSPGFCKLHGVIIDMPDGIGVYLTGEGQGNREEKEG
jgi:hypothetical protein